MSCDTNLIIGSIDFLSSKKDIIDNKVTENKNK